MKAAWWWIDRWRTSSAYNSMTAEERGVYREFLDELWLRDGVLPLDELHLARIAGGADVLERVKAKVLGHFVKTDQGWRNVTHDSVQADSRKRAEKQSRYRNRKGNVTASPSPSKRTTGDASNVTVTLPKESIIEAAYRVGEPPMPNVTPVPEWEAQAKSIWSTHLGGENDYVYADLVSVVRRFGPAKTLIAWEAYCKAQAQNQGGKFASARSFAQKPGPWMPKEQPKVEYMTREKLLASQR